MFGLLLDIAGVVGIALILERRNMVYADGRICLDSGWLRFIVDGTRAWILVAGCRPDPESSCHEVNCSNLVFVRGHEDPRLAADRRRGAGPALQPRGERADQVRRIDGRRMIAAVLSQHAAAA